MKRLDMSYKQAFGALYAISNYLDENDEYALNLEVRSEYERGFRAGASSVIDGITRIVNKYQSKGADV